MRGILLFNVKYTKNPRGKVELNVSQVFKFVHSLLQSISTLAITSHPSFQLDRCLSNVEFLYSNSNH